MKCVARWLILLLVPGMLFAQVRPTASFDHFTTGFELEGAHRIVDCEACHVGGAFQGTPTQCGSCHVLGGRVRASAKPLNHPATTELCGECHRQAAWLPVARINRDQISGGATGKNSNHIASTNNCDACHNAVNFAVLRVDHAEVIGTCVSCHNGRTATGKTASHPITGNACDNCHTTIGWTPARP